MKRADKRVQQVEEAIDESGVDAADWTEEQHRRLALMHRYRNTAKRDFERSRRALEQRRGARLREAYQEEKLVAWREDREEKKIAGRRIDAGNAPRQRDHIRADRSTSGLVQSSDAGGVSVRQTGPEFNASLTVLRQSPS